MNISQFMAAITKATTRLGDYWEAKVVAGGILAAAQFHFRLMSLFVLLIIIDLITKCRACP